VVAFAPRRNAKVARKGAGLKVDPELDGVGGGQAPYSLSTAGSNPVTCAVRLPLLRIGPVHLRVFKSMPQSTHEGRAFGIVHPIRGGPMACRRLLWP
jgi:hypothetical protein